MNTSTFPPEMECPNDTNATIPPNSSCGEPGPIQYPSTALSAFGAIMVTTYGLMCIVGLVGNGLVIFVILRYTKMKTVTNMYILNLSIADFLFMNGLPLIMTTVITKHWVSMKYVANCSIQIRGFYNLRVVSYDLQVHRS